MEIAAQQGHEMIFRELIAEENFIGKEINGRPLIFHLAKQGIKHVPILQALFEKDNDIIHYQHKMDGSILFLASQNEDFNIFKWLVSKGVNINQEDIYRSTPALIAAHRNNPELLKQLFDLNADLFKEDEKKQSPILIAIKKGWADIIQNISHKAIAEGSTEKIKKLIEYKIDMNHPDEYGRTPLMMALKQGKIDVLEILAENKNIDFNQPDNLGRTPVFIAAQHNQPEVILFFEKLAEQKRIDLNQPDKYGRTPAFIAAENGHLEIFKSLAKSGVDLNKPDETGLTPALIAAQKGNTEIIQCLCSLAEKKENPSVNLNLIGGSLGCSAASIALRFGHMPLFKLLVEHKAIDLTLPDKNGRTLPIIAIQQKNREAIDLLISQGVDFSKETAPGESPLLLAIKNGHWDIVIHLLMAIKKCPHNVLPDRNELKNAFIRFLKTRNEAEQSILLADLFKGNNGLSVILLKPASPLLISTSSSSLFKPADDPILAEIIDQFRLPLLQLLSHPETKETLSPYIQKKQGKLYSTLKPSILLKTLAKRRNDFIIEGCLTDKKQMSYIKSIIQKGLTDPDPIIQKNAEIASADFKDQESLIKAYPSCEYIIKRQAPSNDNRG